MTDKKNSPAIRDKSGRFKPGKSPNPSGRPKSAHKFKELCQAKSEAALNKIVDIMENATRPADQLKAAEIILSYAHGKPVQGVEHSGGVSIKVNVHRKDVNAASGSDSEPSE